MATGVPSGKNPDVRRRHEPPLWHLVQRRFYVRSNWALRAPCGKPRLRSSRLRLQLRHETSNQPDFQCQWLLHGKSRSSPSWFFNRRTAESSELQL